MSCVTAAAEIQSLAGSINMDVAVIGLDSDSPTKEGLQVGRSTRPTGRRSCGYARRPTEM